MRKYKQIEEAALSTIAYIHICSLYTWDACPKWRSDHRKHAIWVLEKLKERRYFRNSSMVVACQTMMFKHQIQRTLNIFVLPRRLALSINHVSHCLQLRKSTIYGRRILHKLCIYFEQTHRMLRMFTLIRYCKQAFIPYRYVLQSY